MQNMSCGYTKPESCFLYAFGSGDVVALKGYYCVHLSLASSVLLRGSWASAPAFSDCVKTWRYILAPTSTCCLFLVVLGGNRYTHKVNCDFCVSLEVRVKNRQKEWKWILGSLINSFSPVTLEMNASTCSSVHWMPINSTGKVPLNGR
jgi:hypothetical protein